MEKLDEMAAARLRAAERSDVTARLGEWAASRVHDASETSIERIMQVLQLDRRAAISLARWVENAGCGRFVIGRKRHKSRICWTFSLKSIGQTINECGAFADIDVASPPGNSASLVRESAMSEAKRSLALVFGTRPDAIEIVVHG